MISMLVLFTLLSWAIGQYFQTPISIIQPFIMAPNPLKKAASQVDIQVSSSRHLMAGLLTTVHGLEELPPNNKYVSVLWLLHPRLGKQEDMASLASAIISAYNRQLDQRGTTDSPGLIAVALDQRNHGSRLVDPIANGDWRSGDEQHAMDMFSEYHGTQLDTSQLITYLSSYLFPRDERILVDHMAIGVSLGGHCAWHCALNDPRITTAVVVIGCPDYINLMKQRARLSKRESWLGSEPPGRNFIGSTDFPSGLVEAVKMFDPAGLLIGDKRNGTEFYPDPSPEQHNTLRVLMDDTLKGKRILNLAGGNDKLVPHAEGAAFINWLQRAIKPGGWYSDGGTYFEDHIFPGVGHEMSGDMTRVAIDFIIESLGLWEAHQAPKMKQLTKQSKL